MEYIRGDYCEKAAKRSKLVISVITCRDYTERSGHRICQCCETGFRVCMPRIARKLSPKCI